MTKVSARWVLKLLGLSKKQIRHTLARDPEGFLQHGWKLGPQLLTREERTIETVETQRVSGSKKSEICKVCRDVKAVLLVKYLERVTLLQGPMVLRYDESSSTRTMCQGMSWLFWCGIYGWFAALQVAGGTGLLGWDRRKITVVKAEKLGLLILDGVGKGRGPQTVFGFWLWLEGRFREPQFRLNIAEENWVTSIH